MFLLTEETKIDNLGSSCCVLKVLHIEVVVWVKYVMHKLIRADAACTEGKVYAQVSMKSVTSWGSNFCGCWLGILHWAQTIQQLLAMGNGVDSYFSVRSLGIHSTSFLALFILAYGIATPGGIFMPSIMVWRFYLVLDHHLDCFFCKWFTCLFDSAQNWSWWSLHKWAENCDIKVL